MPVSSSFVVYTPLNPLSRGDFSIIANEKVIPKLK
jgi:hypothetical protein